MTKTNPDTSSWNLQKGKYLLWEREGERIREKSRKYFVLESCSRHLTEWSDDNIFPGKGNSFPVSGIGMAGGAGRGGGTMTAVVEEMDGDCQSKSKALVDCSAALWRGILRQHCRLKNCSWYWYWLNCQIYHGVLRLCARYSPSLYTEYMCMLGKLIVNQKTHIALAQDVKSHQHLCWWWAGPSFHSHNRTALCQGYRE